jgi:hypothetical protein
LAFDGLLWIKLKIHDHRVLGRTPIHLQPID